MQATKLLPDWPLHNAPGGLGSWILIRRFLKCMESEQRRVLAKTSVRLIFSRGMGLLVRVEYLKSEILQLDSEGWSRISSNSWMSPEKRGSWRESIFSILSLYCLFLPSLLFCLFFSLSLSPVSSFCHIFLQHTGYKYSPRNNINFTREVPIFQEI